MVSAVAAWLKATDTLLQARISVLKDKVGIREHGNVCERATQLLSQASVVFTTADDIGQS